MFFCRLQHKVIKTFLFRHGGYMNIFKDLRHFHPSHAIIQQRFTMVLGDVLYGSLHLICVLSKGGLF